MSYPSYPSSYQKHFHNSYYSNKSYPNNIYQNNKTVLCRYFQTGSCERHNCSYAHNMNELKPRHCPFGQKCRFDRRKLSFDKSRRPCCFIHPGEVVSKYEVYKRAMEYNDNHKHKSDFDILILSVVDFIYK